MPEFIARWFTPSNSDGGARPAPVPKAPTVDSTAKTAKSESRAKAKGVSRSKTILTSALGETEEPETKKKTLLG